MRSICSLSVASIDLNLSQKLLLKGKIWMKVHHGKPSFYFRWKHIVLACNPILLCEASQNPNCVFNKWHQKAVSCVLQLLAKSRISLERAPFCWLQSVSLLDLAEKGTSPLWGKVWLEGLSHRLINGKMKKKDSSG